MDSDLKRRVEFFLKKKGVSSLPRLSVDVKGSQVMLHGTVRSFYERQLCLCCRHVAGVTQLIDDLKVEMPQVEATR